MSSDIFKPRRAPDFARSNETLQAVRRGRPR